MDNRKDLIKSENYISYGIDDSDRPVYKTFYFKGGDPYKFSHKEKVCIVFPDTTFDIGWIQFVDSKPVLSWNCKGMWWIMPVEEWINKGCELFVVD